MHSLWGQCVCFREVVIFADRCIRGVFVAVFVLYGNRVGVLVCPFFVCVVWFLVLCVCVCSLFFSLILGAACSSLYPAAVNLSWVQICWIISPLTYHFYVKLKYHVGF